MSSMSDSGAKSPIPELLIDQLNSYGSTDPQKVGITAGTFGALGVFTLFMFQILRPNNKIVYAPRFKYADEGKAPPKVDEGFFSWVKPVMRYKEHDLLPLIGLDGVTFLRFIRMMRWMLSTLAVVLSVVLMPLDVIYNINHPTRWRPSNRFYWINMSNVHGSYLWGHVAMSYIGTGIALAFVWYHYREMVRLRWTYFRSEEYQTAFYARTLMITDVPKKLQSDPALSTMLSQIKMPYPTTEVHIGRRVGRLPELIEKHNDLVRELEHVLARYLKNPDRLPAKRPTVRIGGFMGCGGNRVDAIDYYTEQINRVEAAVQHQRETIQEKKPEMYGFASLAAVPYAHMAAKSLQRKKPGGMRIALAPPPSGIIWRNLTLSSAARTKSSFFGFLLLLGLFFLNTIPLIIVSLISNMTALSRISWLRWLNSWKDASSWSFDAVSGLGAPVIMGAMGYLLPLFLRRIAKYRGVQTRFQLDRILIGQLFGFLVISQFIFFSLIGVILSIVSGLIVSIKEKMSAGDILSSLGSQLADSIKTQYVNQSTYWLTWLPLRGYLAVFDLAQVIKLLLVWVQKGLFGRTPRDVREYTKPPVFDYWIYYSNFLFMTAVAMLYAPLAPLIVIYAAAIFWLNSFIYKYQLMYVFVTKHETGGMLWRPTINRLLVCIGFMQVILMLCLALDDRQYVQAVAAAPPFIVLIAFKVYCRRTFDPKFDWYIPSEAEFATATTHAGDARHNRLQRRFGHPTLSSKLFTPMVHAKVKHLLPQVYRGKIDTGVSNVDGRRVETGEVAGGLKIAAIEEDQLEYDPHKDSDVRSIMSGTTMGGFAGNKGVGTPGSVAPSGDYFKSQYANYITGGAAAPREEIEMNSVMARDSRDNLLEKYSDSHEGTLTGGQPDFKSGAYGMQRTATNGSVYPDTPNLDMTAPPQQAGYVDPYANAATPGSYLPPFTHHQGTGSQSSLGSYGNMLYGSGAAGQRSQASPPQYGRPEPPTRTNSNFSSSSAQMLARAQQPSPGPQQAYPMAGAYTTSPQQQAQHYYGAGYPQQPQQHPGPRRQATGDYMAGQPYPGQAPPSTQQQQQHAQQGSGQSYYSSPSGHGGQPGSGHGYGYGYGQGQGQGGYRP
ncbi:uncharacterized protein PFL1_00756 [Pseudozyma flocculosa PF-1]|uniref:DUF221-domain-containing protein n=1 Tax=Pseudozyma flocculosa TaxID=84751 RepID=A0A5C3F2X9_9BASI|nr:uncharacterized protein PFL1_00756 [Pseudozyma flocculosa PF-1]EPQ31421.1 hypothetical protein PFL1_00756 [Pseudozyma flocculosa PF-1]SPO38798.1 uncharacterized protein PSFLO_04277 [Pseudozyma flocculosa]